MKNELQQARNAATAEAEKAAKAQATADAALAQQKAEAPADAEATARHAEELRALEERLKKEFEEELARAVNAAATANPDQQVAIEAAVATRLQELNAKHEQEVSSAIERGRMEASTKLRLKDAQIMKAQNRLKELEAQLASLKAGGASQPIDTVAAGAKPAAATQPNAAAAKAAPPSTSAPKPAGPANAQKPAGGAVAPRPSGLPQKPGAVPLPGAGRGRGGAVRGAARGGAPGLAIRGAAPAATEGATTDAGPSDGVSIMGAASKRPREEGEASGDDSLAKRLKPEGTPKPPVQLRRDRVPPPTAP